VDRSAISFAMPILSRLFHLDNNEIGLTLGAFNIGYALMVFAGGVMVDRWGSRKVWLYAALVWSLSIFSTAFAGGLAMLFTVRLVLGLAEGPNFPALNRVVGEWLPTYLTRAYGLDLRQVGMFTVLQWAVAAVFLYDGRKSDRKEPVRD
jgi:MFS transporter, ACS family, aldohexuronate transporter